MTAKLIFLLVWKGIIEVGEIHSLEYDTKV